jgi:hypothetical protein
MILCFSSPRCAVEIAEHLGVKLVTIQSAMRRLWTEGYLEPLTPDRPQACLYGLTHLGKQHYYEMSRQLTEPLPEDFDPALYSWIHAGAIRRHVFRALAKAGTIQSLRKSLHESSHGTSATHIFRAIRQLQSKYLASREDQTAHLTGQGYFYHQYLLR